MDQHSSKITYNKIETGGPLEQTGFNTLIMHYPTAAALFEGADFIIIAANTKMLSHWHKDPGIIGASFKEKFFLQQDIFSRKLEECLKTGKEIKTDTCKIEGFNDGKTTVEYYDYIFTPLTPSTGQVSQILCICNDVTRQTLSIIDQKETEAHMQLLRDAVPAMIFYLDADQRYVSVNKVFLKWFETIPEEAIGKSVQEFLGETAYQKVLPHLRIAYDGSEEKYEMFAPSRMGEPRWLSIVYTPHKKNNMVIGLIVHATDITKNKQTEIALQGLQTELENEVQLRTKELAQVLDNLKQSNMELENSNKALKRSNEELSQYAYVASHDLQEPLRKIRFFTSLLRDGAASLSADEIIGKISRSAERMRGLIDDLLKFSRLLETRAHIKKVDFQEIINAVWDDFEVLTVEKNAVLILENLPSAEAYSLQLNQLFYNLIGNSLKFTSPGRTPVITIKSAHATPQFVSQKLNINLMEKDFHHITVEDNGIGFDLNHSEQIFDIFKRLHNEDIYPGSGIGLALCRRIVSNHGGYLHAESEIGKGSVFHIFLPFRSEYTSAETAKGSVQSLSNSNPKI